jgi:hypothetical protein
MKQSKTVQFTPHDSWYYYDVDMVTTQHEERRQGTLTGAQWRKHQSEQAEIRRKQRQMQPVPQSTTATTTITPTTTPNSWIQRCMEHHAYLLEDEYTATSNDRDEVYADDTYENDSHEYSHLFNPWEGEYPEEKESPIPKFRYRAISFAQLKEAQQDHRMKTSSMLNELKATWKEANQQIQEAQATQHFQQETAKAQEALRQIVLKAEPQLMKAALRGWRKRTRWLTNFYGQLLEKKQQLEMESQEEERLILEVKDQYFDKLYDVTTTTYEECSFWLKKLKHQISRGDKTRQHIYSIQSHIRTVENQIVEEKQWRQSLKEKQVSMAEVSRRRQDQRFKQQLQEGHERMLAQRSRYQETLRSQDELRRQQQVINRTRKHQRKQSKAMPTPHQPKAPAHPLKTHPLRTQPKPDPPVIPIQDPLPILHQIFRHRPPHQKVRARHPTFTNHPAQSAPSHRKATRMQPFGDIILRRDGGLLPSFLPSSFPPSISQHHSWIAAPHRKTLRQQPF